jgi:hypothetical protein
VDEERLGQTGHPNQKDMPAADHTDKDLPNDLVLSDDDLSNFLAERLESCVEFVYGIRRNRLFHEKIALRSYY